MDKGKKIELAALVAALAVVGVVAISGSSAHAASLLDATTTAAMTAGSTGIQDTVNEWIVNNFLLVVGTVVAVGLFIFAAVRLPRRILGR